MAKRTWKLALLMGAVVAIGAAPAVRADDASELEKIKQENAALKERVDGLESEVGDLKAMVKNLVSLQPPARTTPETPGLTQADVETLKTLARSPRQPVTSSLRAEVYGKIKADAAYDTQRVSTGDYIRWVESERYNSNDNEFNLTANETRLGVKIFGPEDDTLRTSGLVEVDFFASDVPENKAEMFMRHAYLLLEWPNSRFSVLAGQTWDVISPLAPYQGSLNYSVAWWAGNIGYRRPQIRVTKAFGQDVEYKLEAALARTIGRSSGFDPGDTGEDAGFPTVQARASTSVTVSPGL